MPAFAQNAGGMLTDKQVDVIVAGIRERWSKPDVFPGAGARRTPHRQPAIPRAGRKSTQRIVPPVIGAAGRGGQKAGSIVEGSFLAIGQRSRTANDCNHGTS